MPRIKIIAKFPFCHLEQGTVCGFIPHGPGFYSGHALKYFIEWNQLFTPLGIKKTSYHIIKEKK